MASHRHGKINYNITTRKPHQEEGEEAEETGEGGGEQQAEEREAPRERARTRNRHVQRATRDRPRGLNLPDPSRFFFPGTAVFAQRPIDGVQGPPSNFLNHL